MIPSYTENKKYKIKSGEFVPFLAGSNNPGTGTYNTQKGRYIKIGKLVFFNFKIECSKLEKSSGYLLIKGLPFSINADFSDPSVFPITTAGEGIFDPNSQYVTRAYGNNGLLIEEGGHLNALTNQNFTTQQYIYGTGFYATNE